MQTETEQELRVFTHRHGFATIEAASEHLVRWAINSDESLESWAAHHCLSVEDARESCVRFALGLTQQSYPRTSPAPEQTEEK